MLVKMKIKTKVRGGPMVDSWRRPPRLHRGARQESGAAAHGSAT